MLFDITGIKWSDGINELFLTSKSGLESACIITLTEVRRLEQMGLVFDEKDINADIKPEDDILGARIQDSKNV